MKKALMMLMGAILLLSIGAANPAEQPAPRLITVSGQAEVKVVPDEVVITLAVTTLQNKLSDAKEQNDAAVKKILAVGTQYKIDPKDMQTSQISIYPRYDRDSYGRSSFTGYEVSKTIVFLFKDLGKFEEFLSDIINAGANNVNGIEFRTSQLRKYMDQARALAVKAAQEKAQAVSGELGQKITRPYSIKEEEISSYDRRYSNTNNFSFSGNQGAEVSEDGTIAVGQIVVKAKFTVSFELE